MRTYPSFSQIEIGEPDANVEWYNARRQGKTPLFLDSFFQLPSFPIHEFFGGNKFLIFGQKGTGKTAAIRYLENKLKETHQTEFIVFKKTFNEESDLHQLTKTPLMVDEERASQYKHYLHAVKRVLIFILLKKTFEETDDKEDVEKNEWINKIKNSPAGEIISLGFDSIRSLISGAGIDINAASDGKAIIDA